MGDHWNGGGDDGLHDDLERQARETMRIILDSAGDLGTRVRQVMDHATGLWEESGAPTTSDPADAGAAHPDAYRAHELARRWARVDFLVDPELPDHMHVTEIDDAALWRVELRERGETRELDEGTEPYRGLQPDPPGPVLPAWDYTFPTIPEIASGERRERIAQTEVLGACHTCNGSGHKGCTACEGKGFLQCPTCHGRASVPCKRCHGRARIANPAAERRARADKSYFQVQAERLASDASFRVADFAERLRQEYGVPLPPSAQWAPTAPASGETIPCPDCTNGSVPCTCGNGKLVCDVCRGSAYAECSACNGSGRVIRHREVVRRFDTRIFDRVVFPAELKELATIDEASLRRVSGNTIWEGNADSLPASAPEGREIPASIWGEALALQSAAPDGDESPADRHIIERKMSLIRVPLVQVKYTFGGREFQFAAIGAQGKERFYARDFPPRWSRVGRFFKALIRDLNGDIADDAAQNSRKIGPRGEISTLEDYRSRRNSQPAAVRVVIEEEAAVEADAPHGADPEPPIGAPQ